MTDEEQLKEKLRAAVLDAAVNSVFAKTGIRMSKPVRAYVEKALSCEIRTGNSAVLSAVDPTSGHTYASVDEFAEALARDPDFQPAQSQSSSGGNGRPQPRHVKQQDLTAERVSPQQIESGEVIVDMSELVHREDLAANEVSVKNQTLLNASLEDIAAGRKKVIFPGRT